MAGVRVPVIPRSIYNNLELAAATSQDLVLAKAVDARSYREATLLVRMHATSTFAYADSKYELRVRTTDPSPDDPATDYLSTSADLAIMTINSASTAGIYLVRTAVASNFGPYLRVYLRATQGAVRGSMLITISVDLCLKA